MSKNIYGGLLDGLFRCPVRLDFERPYQPDDRSLVIDEDFIYIQGVVVSFLRILHCRLQELTERRIIALGRALIIGDQIRGKDIAYLAFITIIERRLPFLER